MKTKSIEEKALKELISRAFDEDIQTGDATTNAVIDESAQAHARWIAKEQGIIAGIEAARTVFQSLDPELEWLPRVKDGEEVKPGMEIVTMRGACRAILTAERTALNIAQRMSGIATKTHKMVKEIEGYPAKILDTRKTAPGLRTLDKFAVRIGGGTNHRMGLFDLAMIKDNHIVAAGGIKKAVSLVRKYSPDLKIEVETTSLDEVKEALKAGTDIIMLDNMSPELMKEAVSLIGGKSQTEASGNISFENLKEVAETGVDFISVGALTHSVKAFDISQQLQQI